MSKNLNKERIAKRAALIFEDNDLVNLGVGIPTMISEYIPEGKTVWLEAENGIIGAGPAALKGEEDYYFKDAGDDYCTILDGGCTFNSATSFGLIRGGHLDYTVLGAMQVDKHGNLANWMVPGGRMAGMGGAMDLVVGAKKVIIATEHTTRNGDPKILDQVTFPLTGEKVVDYIITELAFIEVTDDGLVLKEISHTTTLDEVIAKTGAPLIVSDDLKVVEI